MFAGSHLLVLWTVLQTWFTWLLMLKKLAKDQSSVSECTNWTKRLHFSNNSSERHFICNTICTGSCLSNLVKFSAPRIVWCDIIPNLDGQACCQQYWCVSRALVLFFLFLSFFFQYLIYKVRNMSMCLCCTFFYQNLIWSISDSSAIC